MILKYKKGLEWVEAICPVAYTTAQASALKLELDHTVKDSSILESTIVKDIDTLYCQTGSIEWDMICFKDDEVTAIGKLSIGKARVISAVNPTDADKYESDFIRWVSHELSGYVPDILVKSAAVGGLAAAVHGTSIKSGSGDVDDITKLIEEITTKTKADISKPKETLDDYVCNETLREELEEIKDFFENESVYKDAGVETPKGILFKGVPGTGKTYAARCLAGSTECYFMSCTASALQGMYIGSGAENIRAIFKGAKQLREKTGKGVYLFIDELDSFGNREHRSGGAGGEEDRTLNQLLAEISGFSDVDGILVLGATNYPDRLDDALMRSGRFSRQITIDRPETEEREAMVRYYLSKIKFPLDDATCEDIAQLTKGLTPADIKEILNEAAILTVRQKLSNITLNNINEAVNKVITKNIRTPDGKLDARLVAAHEVGHVLAEVLYANSTPIKVTNYSYGNAGGFTQTGNQLEGIVSKERHIAEVKMLLGGRAAESVMYGYVTNGASNDLDRAKKLLHRYYSKYHFEEYQVKDLEQTVLNKLNEIFLDVVSDFSTSENYKLLNWLTDELEANRVLYAKDIVAICAPIILKGDIL